MPFWNNTIPLWKNGLSNFFSSFDLGQWSYQSDLL
jgi:hypothetical protein